MNPPNWFTFASIFCGFSSILISAAATEPSEFYRAGLLIVFAGLFDTLDGRVARMTGTGSELGVQLDSLADVVSFGIAPTLLVHYWGLHKLGPVGIAAVFIFLICGIMRLARFNVKTDGGKKIHSCGLPITAAGGLLAAMVMAHTAIGAVDVANPVNPLWLVLALSGLMISEVPYRLLAELRRSKTGIAVITTLLATGIAVGLKYGVAIFLFSFGLTYIASGPILALRQRGAVRRQSASLAPLDDEE